MCQSWLSPCPPDSQSTAPAGFEGTCADFFHHQHYEDPMRGTWASQAAKMHPRHLPRPGTYSSEHSGHLHCFGVAAGAGQKTLEHLKRCPASTFGRVGCSPGVSVSKDSLPDSFFLSKSERTLGEIFVARKCGYVGDDVRKPYTRF